MEITSVTNTIGIDRAVVANTESQKGTAKTAQDSQTTRKAAPQKPAGAPPAGGHSGAKPAAASTSGASTTATASTTSTKSYDKRDLNQDGIVTPQEASKYSVLHPALTPDSILPTSTSQVKQGVTAYQQAQGQAVTTTSLDTLA